MSKTLQARPKMMGEHSQGQLIWAHVGSVAVLPAIREVLQRAAIIDPAITYQITTSEDSGVIASDVEVLPETLPHTIQDFVDQNAPDVCIWADASMNSSLYSQTQKTNVAMVLIRPRLQDLEKRTWLWRKTVARQALRSVAFAHAETPEVAANLRALGLPFDRIEMLGPLVGAVVPLGFNEAERDELGGPLTSRPVWLAVNVPGDEVAMLAKAFIQAQRSAHRMLLILQTNDPIAANAHLIEQGLIVHHRDVEGEPDTLTQVFITDGNTEMGLWYRLASMAYMGGSFSDNPVASPLQAAALGSAILHGPLVSDHRDEYDRLAHGHASMGIEADHQLADAIVTLLAPDQSATLANAAWQVVSDGAEVTDRLVDVILALIDQ